MVEKGFATLAVMAQFWENFLSEEFEHNESREEWASGRATIGRAFSSLLQQAWLTPMSPLVRQQIPFSIYMAISIITCLDFILLNTVFFQ